MNPMELPDSLTGPASRGNLGEFTILALAETVIKLTN